MLEHWKVIGAKEKKSQEMIDKYNSLKGAKAISSDMFFGESNGDES